MNASKEAIKKEIANLSPEDEVLIRKLTPRECGRLMGVREEKLDVMLNCGVSKTALYHMFGNSIVVDQLFYLFEQIWYPTGKATPRQLTIFDCGA